MSLFIGNYIDIKVLPKLGIKAVPELGKKYVVPELAQLPPSLLQLTFVPFNCTYKYIV